ncbi:ATP-dependent DNA ligase [Variovorax fucosicus]|uniref:ATP-dependent DNA ligase n=1 Tax=Variovorax fucosicus TaxID=3053517 RepID=UPI002577BD2D|nr:hypothetical protein [Variovorax sp. J22G47]MDM0054063.1 hypothetical protein [Variovorax sp. J22G47]
MREQNRKHTGRPEPLLEREAGLAELLTPPLPNILLVGHFKEGGEDLFKTAVHQLELEGLVAKHADSRYLPGVRSAEWVKVKRKGAIPAQRFKRT